MSKLQNPRIRLTLFQLAFWLTAAVVLFFAQSMEMPRRFALPPAVSAATLGFLICFVFPAMLAYSTRTRFSVLTALLGILLAALVVTPISRLVAFIYLEFDYASFQWVYYFQGTLRLVLLFLVWCGLFLYWGRYFGHAYYLVSGPTDKRREDAPRHLKAERRRTLSLVPLADIIAIQSADEYVAVITNDHEYLRRDTLKSLEQKLGPNSFTRVHKSTIVNLAHVREIAPLPKGDFVLTMLEGQQFKGSRRFKAEFEDRLEPRTV